MGDIVDQKGWGICGFTAVLQYLHQNGQLKEFGQDLTIDAIQQRLGAEVVTYLAMAQVERPAITTEILDFTHTFGPIYNYASIDELVNKIKDALKDTSVPDPYRVKGIGAAMTYNAVIDYIKWVNPNLTITEVPANSASIDEIPNLCNGQGKSFIIGLGNSLNNKPTYNNLGHWIYQDTSGILYSWGKQVTVSELKAGYALISYIVMIG